MARSETWPCLVLTKIRKYMNQTPEITSLTFVLLGNAKAKQSVQHNKTSGAFYTPIDVKNYQKGTAWEIKSQLPRGFKKWENCGLGFSATYIFTPPKSLKKSELKRLERGEKVYKITKPDLTDNLNKPVLDAMEGIVFDNDSRIAHIEKLEKRYGNEPKIIVKIWIL